MEAADRTRHRLNVYLVRPVIPPRYRTEADHDADIHNNDYLFWEQQNTLLQSPLQRGGSNFRSRGRGFRVGRGCGGRNNVQCQVCFRSGHTAQVC